MFTTAGRLLFVSERQRPWPPEQRNRGPVTHGRRSVCTSRYCVWSRRRGLPPVLVRKFFVKYRTGARTYPEVCGFTVAAARSAAAVEAMSYFKVLLLDGIDPA